MPNNHRQGYQALGIGFVPFVVNTLGRMHEDELRTVWHRSQLPAPRQIARNYQRRG